MDFRRFLGDVEGYVLREDGTVVTRSVICTGDPGAPVEVPGVVIITRAGFRSAFFSVMQWSTRGIKAHYPSELAGIGWIRIDDGQELSAGGAVEYLRQFLYPNTGMSGWPEESTHFNETIWIRTDSD